MSGAALVLVLGASVTLGTAVLMPPALWIVAREGFPAAAAPYVVTTVVVHVVYFYAFYALPRAYREADDSVGVMYLHPVPYITCIGLGLVLFLAPRVVRDSTALRREWAVNWRTILIASTMNLTGYLLVLFAFRLSRAGYVAGGGGATRGAVPPRVGA